MAKLTITWKHSAIGRPDRQGLTIRALGLRKLHQTVTHEDTPQIRGMIRAVEHLVEWSVEE
ncbi:50S ribosomal protein L30 [Aminomonas paucivorans]|uniref:50S ribosomal protein L30 n=1 Tax=Aminomonas paucivorans DSM 12260 TaxID=584708 RepID=E3CUM7_9BACT|nr:50S ribosomal protein L30 [Aminomonas paucivorans]EFQ24043.1 LSU ribosomal protein L30P [Aminomonas paucivorans DSM 12260]